VTKTAFDLAEPPSPPLRNARSSRGFHKSLTAHHVAIQLQVTGSQQNEMSDALAIGKPMGLFL
jgi:hypothetical protein